MAKKNTSASSSGTTLSARFNDSELEILRRAAEIRQWSLAQLIQLGAYEKAVNIINASGEHQLAIRSVLAEVAMQLVRPEIKAIDLTDSPVEVDVDTFLPPDVHVDASVLGEMEESAFVRAVAGLGSEIAPLLRDELARARITNKAAKNVLLDLIEPKPGATVSTQVPAKPEISETRSADASANKSKSKK